MLVIDAISVIRQGVRVLHNISVGVGRGQVLAVVGESGAGKSTLINAILGLVPLAGGRITWDGQPVAGARPSLVLQEPRAAFNPVWPLRVSVLEPLEALGQRVEPRHLARLCAALNLSMAVLDRRPGEISIGQAQRVGILRAIIAAPPLVLFDEPLSALDAVTQKQSAALIAQVQREVGFAAVIVTHDLGYALAYADQIAVLKHGALQELTPPAQFRRQPQSPYGHALARAAVALGGIADADAAQARHYDHYHHQEVRA